MRGTTSLAALVLACGIGQTASGAVFTLTGGDPGEGFEPWGTKVAAVDFAPDSNFPGPHTVQGATFTLSNPHVSITAGTPFGANPEFDVQSTANDVALSHVLNNLIYADTITITLSGLDPAKLHRVELLVALGGGAPARDQTVFVVDGSPAQGDVQVLLPNVEYSFRYDVLPTAGGLITLYLDTITTNGFTDPNPIVNAIVVSVPEPATLGLLAVGAMGTLLTRRRGR
jgi:hypothetical protein